MKILFRSQSRKLFPCRAIGTLLLVIPFCGIASQFSAAQAQPDVLPPVQKAPVPLTPEQKLAVNKFLTISSQEKWCKTKVDIKVNNATLDDVLTRLKEILPAGNFKVEARNTGPISASFDLKQVRVGDLLVHVAALGGSKLYLTADGLLISPETQLSDGELQDIKRNQYGEWAQSRLAGGNGWSNKNNATLLFTQAIAQEVTGEDADHLPQMVIKTTFGKFSPDAQKILTEMAEWFGPAYKPTLNLPPLKLNAASPITVDTTPNTIAVKFTPDTSAPGARTLAIQTALVQYK